MTSLSKEDKEKADEILRLFSMLSAKARPLVLGKLTSSGLSGSKDMEVKL